MTKNDFFDTLLHFGRRPVAFEPATDDDDELTQAIQNDPTFHDNHWDLHEKVDVAALEAFWDEAAKDTATPPPASEES